MRFCDRHSFNIKLVRLKLKLPYQNMSRVTSSNDELLFLLNCHRINLLLLSISCEFSWFKSSNVDFRFLNRYLSSSSRSVRFWFILFSNRFNLIQVINLYKPIVSTREKQLSFAEIFNFDDVHLLFMIKQFLELSQSFNVPNKNSKIFACWDDKSIAQRNSDIIDYISMSMKNPLKTSIRHTPYFNKSWIKQTYLSSAPVIKNRFDQSKHIDDMDAGTISERTECP